MNDVRGAFNAAQVEQLLSPINPRRVLQANGHSHVSQQDITAHLIRVFGFGGFDTELVRLELVYERQKDNDPTQLQGWTACYLAVMRITVRDPYGNKVASYENVSTGDATNQKSKAAAHDLAVKSAVSLATKRCAINLGDQFGLSLYNKGQTTALVMGTKVMPAGKAGMDGDVSANVAQQESLGIDETYHENGTDGDVGLSPDQQENLTQTLGAQPIQTPPQTDEVAPEGPRTAAARVGAERRAQADPNPDEDLNR